MKKKYYIKLTNGELLFSSDIKADAYKEFERLKNDGEYGLRFYYCDIIDGEENFDNEQLLDSYDYEDDYNEDEMLNI